MPYFKVIEGEGVSGPLGAVSAETTTLLSCMGMVFHNRRLRVAGLYHYGANTLHQAPVQNTILQMINDLQPDDIYLTAPPVQEYHGAPVSTVQDRNAVELFFLAQGCSPQSMPDRRWSNYRLVDGSFAVNDANDVGSGMRLRSMDMATQLPSPEGRRIKGNTSFYFYGGKGPATRILSVPADDTELLAVRRKTGGNVFG